MHFYGYKQLDPCPHCNTPRVGADYDNSFEIGPGILHKPCQQGQDLSVHITIYSPDKGRRWVRVLVKGIEKENGITSLGADLDLFDFYVSEDVVSPVGFKNSLKEWIACPECGGNIDFGNGEELGGHITFVGRCPERGRREKIEHLPGCEKCSRSYRGGHFVD